PFDLLRGLCGGREREEADGNGDQGSDASDVSCDDRKIRCCVHFKTLLVKSRQDAYRPPHLSVPRDSVIGRGTISIFATSMRDGCARLIRFASSRKRDDSRKHCAQALRVCSKKLHVSRAPSRISVRSDVSPHAVVNRYRAALQRSPKLTPGCSPEVDHCDFRLLMRASADAHEAALLRLSPVVCAGPPRRPS